MDWRDAVKAACPNAKFDEPLARYTTFKIGGPADVFVEPRSVAELTAVVAAAKKADKPLTPIGWGSNLLVRDGGVRGVVLRLRGDFERIEFLNGGVVRAGAAVRVPQLVTAAAERGLSGDEPLVGVPGTVGGALVMNAGTREGEIGPLVREVRALDPETLSVRALGRSDLQFSYRHSNLEKLVVLDVDVELKPDDKGVIMRRVQQHQQRRLQTQPIHTFNVGSTFKNPPGRYVAKLIEEAGLKGLACGGARVSPMHANFIENFNGAKAADVLALVDKIRAAVREREGVELELEMKVVGQA
jgi:UDP-N-acetylmuramate dehydrogenase